MLTLLSNTMTMALVIVSILFLPVLLYTIYAGIKVNSTFKKYSSYTTSRNLTGAEAARMILNKAGLRDVQIVPTKGMLTDHYNPSDKTVYLSQGTFNVASISAVGVAAHEVGHAIQHAKNYAPLKLRSWSVPIVNMSSKLSLPMFILSSVVLMATGVSLLSNIFLTITIVLYGIYMLFTLITLPVEYNASSRAKKLLIECNILNEDELKGSAKVLSAAAQTYLAAFLLSFIQVIRMLLILLSRQNRR